MNKWVAKTSPPKRRGPPDFFAPPAPPPPPLRRPPGPLKVGPSVQIPKQRLKLICLRFRTRILLATASVDDFHQNIIRLSLQPSIVQRLIREVADRLPGSLQKWFDSAFPEWNLPPQLIIKKQKKGWDEEFETEKAAYTKLEPLQGVVIPKCFGELNYGTTRALLLSDIGGVCLATPEGSLLEMSEFRHLLFQTLDALSQFKIQQDDIKLDNFHFTGDRIMAVDLERIRDEYPSPDLLVSDVKSAVNFLAEIYEDNQYSFWADGFIVVDT